MIKKVRVYNAGFGDCFLLYGENYKLLVDAGTATIKNSKDIIDDINLENKNGIYGMLTHFHEDHYKWFEKLKSDSFNVFYLPDFFSDIEIKFQLCALTFLSKKSNMYKFAHQLLLLIPNLLKNKIIKNNGEVHFVKAFDLIVDNIEILWPQRSGNHDIKKY